MLRQVLSCFQTHTEMLMPAGSWAFQNHAISSHGSQAFGLGLELTIISSGSPNYLLQISRLVSLQNCICLYILLTLFLLRILTDKMTLFGSQQGRWDHTALRWALKRMIVALLRSKDTPSYRVDGHMKMGWCGCKARNMKECQKPPEARGRKECFLGFRGIVLTP